MKPNRPIPPSNRVMTANPETAVPVRAGPDEETAWVAAARHGDAVAFRHLVERHQESAVRLAFRMVRTQSDAEEVAQDAFVRAWRALPEFRGESRFGTWLHRIVVRRALDRVERLKTRTRRETPLGDVEPRVLNEAAPEEGVATGNALRLERAMGTLSERERAAIELYYHEDRSVEDVANILELPDGTVKTLLHRARAKLRARLPGKE